MKQLVEFDKPKLFMVQETQNYQQQTRKLKKYKQDSFWKTQLKCWEIEKLDQKANSPFGIKTKKSGPKIKRKRMKLDFGSKSIPKTEDPKHTL